MIQKIIAIGRKNILIRFSSRSFLIFFLILPLIFTFLLGQAQPGSTPDGDNRRPLLVVDLDNSDISAQLFSNLAASTIVRPTLTDVEMAAAKLEANDIAAVLTIPAGFGDAVASAQTSELDLQKAPNNNDAIVIEQAIAQASNALNRELQIAFTSAQTIGAYLDPAEFDSDEVLAEARTLARQTIEAAPPRLNVVQPPESLLTGYDPLAHQSAGQVVTWVFITLLGASGLFVAERNSGTLRRLLTTPTGRMTFMLGTMSGELAMGLLQMLILIVFGALVMGVNWGRSAGGLTIMVISFGLTSVALGTLLGSFARTEGQASSLSIVFGMVMAMLGGCWWPIELFPQTVRAYVQYLPTTMAMQGFIDLLVRGQGVAGILPEATALLGLAAVFTILGALRLQFE